MKIALTGGTGFLGRYLIEHLCEQGHQLRCWYRASSDRSGLERWSEQLEWQQGELGNAEATPALIDGVDAVVHSALYRPSGRNFLGGGDHNLISFLEANFMGTMRLMHAAHEANIPRFVFISTCAVHDEILDDRPLDEKHPLWAKSHYGAHKAALEKFVHSYGLGHRWPICALRPTGIYGLAHPPKDSKWFDLVGKVLQGQKIESKRGGKEVHAADVAKAVGLLLNTDTETIRGQSYNCYDIYIAEQTVAMIAKELSNSASEIAELNQGPKHQIETGKLRALGMEFGGDPLLRQTIQQMIESHS